MGTTKLLPITYKARSTCQDHVMTYSASAHSSTRRSVFSVPRGARRALAVLPLVFLASIPGCSGSVDPIDGSGGSGSGGEVSGTGGVVSSGGSSLGSGGAGTGGHIASGGSSLGSGGAAATGGAASGGAASGGALGTGGGEGDGFHPCPETGPCKVLPLGDSITFGLNTADPEGGGYRVELFRLAHSEGHDITFTGTQSPNGPSMVDGVPFPKNHAGISGQTIDQIAGRIPNPDLGDMPHIILVHAGTNDIYQNGWETADARLGNLLDKLIAQAPDALLVISTIIPYPAQAQRVMTFNSTVEGMVDERAADGAHMIFVDQFAGFPAEELGDGIHPNKTGYARMGAKWYDTIKSYLP